MPVILEVAMLTVSDGQTEAFEAALRRAQALIASIPGDLSHQVDGCVERDHEYLLLVRGRELEDHTIGFRTSALYQARRKVLHPLYRPVPEVSHYALAS